MALFGAAVPNGLGRPGCRGVCLRHHHPSQPLGPTDTGPGWSVTLTRVVKCLAQSGWKPGGRATAALPLPPAGRLPPDCGGEFSAGSNAAQKAAEGYSRPSPREWGFHSPFKYQINAMREKLQQWLLKVRVIICGRRPRQRRGPWRRRQLTPSRRRLGATAPGLAIKALPCNQSRGGPFLDQPGRFRAASAGSAIVHKNNLVGRRGEFPGKINRRT